MEIPPVIVFLLITVLGLFIFWKGCVEKKKNISSIFDIFLISSLFAVIYSRISYIAINWSEFTKLIWYWIPYEKYGEDIYLFRLLPWKYLSVWDGGFNVFSLVLGFMVMATILTIFMKRWRWKDLFLQIYFAGISVLCLMYGYIGVLTEEYSFLKILGVVLLVELISFVISRIAMQGVGKERLKNRITETASILAIMLTSGYISYFLLNMELHMFEVVNVYIFIIWLVLCIVYFLMDLRRANVSIEKLSSVRNMGSIDINQPIKIVK